MKCWICGKEATRTLTVHREFNCNWEEKPSRKIRSFCDECYETEKNRINTQRSEYIRLKKAEMFERAMEVLESQGKDLYSKKEAIDVVKDFMEKYPDKFDSSDEVIAAIILVHNRIHCKMQYPIGKYQVDFLLDELKVVLEIDGERHQNRKKYDSERDAFIKRTLGSEWEIIRIKTDYIEQNADRLVDAIEKMCDFKKFGCC